MPIIFLLLFVYVFGGTLGAGLGTPGGGRAEYLNYVVPGILLMTIAAAVNGTSVSVAMDKTEGIVARFRTMAIARASVLTGHVLGSVIQTLLSLLIVLLVAIALGFRPSAGPLGWLAVFAVLAMTSFALTWLAVALGLVARTVEEASNTPMPLILLPFLGSGLRTHRLDAGRAAPVRRVPALHPRHPDRPGTAHQRPRRHPRHRRHRLERRHRTRQLPVGAQPLQPAPQLTYSKRSGAVPGECQAGPDWEVVRARGRGHLLPGDGHAGAHGSEA